MEERIMTVSRVRVWEELLRAVEYYREISRKPGRYSAAEQAQNNAMGRVQLAYMLDLITENEKHEFFRQLDLDYLI